MIVKGKTMASFIIGKREMDANARDTATRMGA
jgi:hypothetical protein